MKTAFLLFLLATSCAAQEFVENPQPRKEPAQTATFWTFRQSWQDPPLRTNRQVFRSKTFWLLHGAYAASVIVDIKHTHGARESWGSELPAIPAIMGMDYLMDRFFTRAMAVEAPIYGIQHYVRDALR